MTICCADITSSLLRRGVVIPNPALVTVADDVDPHQIAPGCILYPGVRIQGSATSIGPGCRLGEEGPLVLENCALGHNVTMKGGFAAQSVFLDDVAVGSAAHIRPGTLLAEQCSTAHAVGLKQTVFLPFVVTGSLINFCDVLMAGGTDRTRHSEVGSSFVHFNFTPHGDKATASLIGDVPHGVFLDQAPVFLGGQGGLVGPVRVAFGNVLAAGFVLRRDALTPNMMLFPTPPNRPASVPYDTHIYRNSRRTVLNNFVYIGNIMALEAWYRHLRNRTMDGCPYRRTCREAGLRALALIFSERIKRLDQLCVNLQESVDALAAEANPNQNEIAAQRRFVRRWPDLRDALCSMQKAYDNTPGWSAFDRMAATLAGNDHIACMKAADDTFRNAGHAWLNEIVARSVQAWKETE